MKKAILLLTLSFLVTANIYAVDLDKEGRDTAYVSNILKRSEKIVSKIKINNQEDIKEVTTILANRYFKLNDIYTIRDAKIKEAKEKLTGDDKKAAIDGAENEKDASLYKTHFAFISDLAFYLNEDQITEIKDGMTFGVVKVTYDSTIDMIPSLKQDERKRIMNWLVEARELAMDAESANKKHTVFGKYKGRINNYLAKKGYDLKQEREDWYKRIKARGGKI